MTFGSLFSGCGGSSLGYQQSGMEEKFAIEYDKSAALTFHLNFPGIPIFCSDITKLDPLDVLDRIKFKPGQLDLIEGSPPCQGFSTNGYRNTKDPRNQLYKSFNRFIKIMQPRYFVMENVKGLVSGKMKPIFEQMWSTFSSSGYKLAWRIMNAANYGTPQQRLRIILIGVRNDVKCKPAQIFPKPLNTIITVRDCFQSIVPDYWPRVGEHQKLHRFMIQVGQGDSAKMFKRNYYFNSKRLAWDKPAMTLPASGIHLIYHPVENRPISVAEAKALQGLPTSFKLYGGMLEQYKRIGNSVCPPLTKAIGLELLKHVKCDCANAKD